MTTIAWDGKTLAADRRQIFGSNKSQATTKIVLHPNLIVGASGGFAAAQAMLRWVAEGCRAVDFPPSQSGDNWARTIVVNRHSHKVYIYEDAPIAIEITSNHYAMGSGCEYALGAMAAGANARDAVSIAGFFDPQTGDGVDSFSLENATPSC